MRAIGFAALSFGAVVALSATLGMSYRSTASPLDDPSGSVSDTSSVSAPTTDAAAPTTDAATPTDTTSLSDSATPSDTASPSDTATPSDTPSDTSTPSSDAPGASGFRPMFSTFASTLTPDVTWAFPSIRSIDPTVTLTGGADEIAITYQQIDTSSMDPIGTPQQSISASAVDSEPHDYGSVFVDGTGLWQVTVTQSWSDNSSDPTATSTYFYVPSTPSLTDMGASEGFYFHGAGTPGDEVEVVSGDFSVFPPSFTVACGTVTVDDSGSWYCETVNDLDVNATYRAIQIDAGSNCNGDEVGCDVSPYADGALSVPSDPIAYFPSVTFEPRPAGGHLVANPTAGSYGTNADYWLWQTFDYYYGSYDAWGTFTGAPLCDYTEAGYVPGTNTCDATGLAPGYYEYSVSQSATDAVIAQYFTLPSTPTLSVTPSGSGRAVLSGTVANDTVATVGDPVHVLVDGNSPKCDGSTVGGTGTWSCIITGLKAGIHTFQAFVEDALAGNLEIGDQHVTGGLSAGSNVVSAKIHVTGTTSDTPSPTPFPNWFFTVTGVDLNNVHPGDTFTVSGTGLPPGATVSGELHSKTVAIGSAVVQPDGTFSLPVTVPSDFPAGAHELVMTLTPAGSSAVASTQPMKVVNTSNSSGSGDSPTPSDSPSPLGSSEGPGIDHHGPNSNILTHGLQSIADVVAHPAKIPAAIEIGLVLLIFAVLPGHLLNATLAEQYERFTKRRAQRTRGPGRWARFLAFLNRAPFVAGLALTTATALLFGFADPRFGFSLASLRLFLGLAIALALVSYITNAVVSRIMRGRWRVDVEVNLRPLGLILTVVGVVVSRLFDFSPGFLIGLVLGLVISEKQLAKHAWRAVLLRTSILLGLALLAWLAFSLFDAREEGGTFASELAIETLVAITTEAVVGLMVELLPLKLLEGEKLYEKSKVIWGSLYLLTVVIFVVAVVPWEGNWAELGSSLWTWIGIVVGFGIVATGIYLYFRIRTHDEVEHGVDTDEDDERLVPIASEDER